MVDKVHKNLVLYDRHEKWLKEKKAEWDVDESFLLRRAMDYYMSKGHKDDEMLQGQISGKI